VILDHMRGLFRDRLAIAKRNPRNNNQNKVQLALIERRFKAASANGDGKTIQQLLNQLIEYLPHD